MSALAGAVELVVVGPFEIGAGAAIFFGRGGCKCCNVLTFLRQGERTGGEDEVREKVCSEMKRERGNGKDDLEFMENEITDRR